MDRFGETALIIRVELPAGLEGLRPMRHATVIGVKLALTFDSCGTRLLSKSGALETAQPPAGWADSTLRQARAWGPGANFRGPDFDTSLHAH